MPQRVSIYSDKTSIEKVSYLEPVRKLYNGQIADMRREGYTLQQIGDTIGVTRERVRQILARYYPSAKTTLVCEERLARIIGCSTHHLVTLRKQGKVQPKKMGWFWLYDRDEIEKARLGIQRFCPHCGEPFLWGFKYCPKCSAERKRYNYPFLSEEAKKRADESSKAWQRRNPERTKEIRRKAVKRYCKKSRRRYQSHSANGRNQRNRTI